MSEINSPQGNTSSKPRRKKLSTKVDLTPMVDLGFLLITFFIFTTSMSEPKAMKLRVPADTKKDNLTYSEEKTLNIIIGDKNFLVYPGNEKDKIKNITNNSTAIRQLIINKKKEVQQKFGANELMVLIKPTSVASYESIVNLLDEMTINDIKRYVLMEPGEDETDHI